MFSFFWAGKIYRKTPSFGHKRAIWLHIRKNKTDVCRNNIVINPHF